MCVWRQARAETGRCAERPGALRQSLIDLDDALALSRQCQFLKVTRSVVYARQKRVLQALMRRNACCSAYSMKEYARHPFLRHLAHDPVSGSLWASGESQTRTALDTQGHKCGCWAWRPVRIPASRTRSTCCIRIC